MKFEMVIRENRFVKAFYIEDYKYVLELQDGRKLSDPSCETLIASLGDELTGEELSYLEGIIEDAITLNRKRISKIVKDGQELARDILLFQQSHSPFKRIRKSIYRPYTGYVLNPTDKHKG